MMVLKRFVIMALGALGLGAFAQGQIPVPNILGEPGMACMTPTLGTTGVDDNPGSIMPIELTDASCADVNKDVNKFRQAWDDVEVAQDALDTFLGGIRGAPTAVQEQTIDFLRQDLQNKQAEKNKYIGDPLADAIYAEKDAIKNFGEAYAAVNGVNGTDTALTEAQTRYDNFEFTYEDEKGTDRTQSISAIKKDLMAAQDNWEKEAYGSDGDLKEDLPQGALDAAKQIANLKQALDDAEAAASAEKSALDSAKARAKQADDALKAAASAVTDTMKGVVNRVKGAGDSVETRIAERVRTLQREYEDAEEDRVDDEEALREDQEELGEAEDDLEGAQDDYDQARGDYEDLVAEDSPDAEELQQAEIAVADAAKRLADAEAEVTAAENAVKSSNNALNHAKNGSAKAAADARKALDDALTAQSGTYNFEEGNPVSALADELLKNPGDAATDQGGALVEALDQTWDATQENAEKIAENSAAIEGLDTGAIGENTAAIAENAGDIAVLEGEIWGEGGTDGMSRIDMNETRSMENRTLIDTNAENIRTNTGLITGLRTDVDSNIGRISQNEINIDTNTGNISMNTSRIGANEAAITGLGNRIGANEGAISGLRDDIGELSESLDVVRAGVAASMALAGMPAINGRGISIGVGSYDGESAFAVGFQIQGEMASFKVGVTSSGGETGASAGVGFQF